MYNLQSALQHSFFYKRMRDVTNSWNMSFSFTLLLVYKELAEWLSSTIKNCSSLPEFIDCPACIEYILGSTS